MPISNTTTTASENIAAGTLLVLGNGPPNTDTDNNIVSINPHNNHQVPFSPQPITYFGRVDKNGRKHDKNGIYFFTVNDMYMLYVGQFKHGKTDGKGILYKNIDERDLGFITRETVNKMTFFTGGTEDGVHYMCRYEGTWNGEFFLRGKGNYYERKLSISGTFVTEPVEERKFKFNGKVKMTYASGDTFSGYLYPYDVFYPKQGLYTYKNGHTYRGTFANYVTNELDHYGTYVDSDGHTYTGAFRKDNKHGKGELLFENGNRFSGNFENDISVFGTMETCLNSTRSVIYTGYVNEKFEAHGNGCKTTYINKKVASKYDGKFLNDKKHGAGVETIYNELYNPKRPGIYS